MSGPAHRFLVEEDAVSGDRATLRGDQARQVATVLRLEPGDRVVVVQGGDDVEVRLDRIDASEVTGTVLSRSRNQAEPRVFVTLALPLLRGDRSEEIVEAVTQLGVSRIVPFTSERSVVRDLSAAKRERWRRIARESAETARRGRLPEIAERVDWPVLFEVLRPPVLVAWEGHGGARPPLALDAPDLSVVIGPEGGLSDEEIALARRHGAVTMSLGPRNLRSETAAIAAVAQLLALADGGLEGPPA